MIGGSNLELVLPVILLAKLASRSHEIDSNEPAMAWTKSQIY